MPPVVLAACFGVALAAATVVASGPAATAPSAGAHPAAVRPGTPEAGPPAAIMPASPPAALPVTLPAGLQADRTPGWPADTRPLGDQCAQAWIGWRGRWEYRPGPCPDAGAQPPLLAAAPGAWPSTVTADLGSDPAGYAFYATDADGIGAAWPGCRPVRYQVNVDALAPAWRPAALRAVRDAASYASAVTGTALVYAGATDVVPFATPGWADPRRTPHAEAVIAYLPAGSPGLGQHPAVAAATVADDGPGGRPPTLARGGIAVSTDVPAWDDPFTHRSILLHEIGHLLGLGHVDSDNQAMNVRNTAGRILAYQAGDLAGLARLRATHPCPEPADRASGA